MTNENEAVQVYVLDPFEEEEVKMGKIEVENGQAVLYLNLGQEMKRIPLQYLVPVVKDNFSEIDEDMGRVRVVKRNPDYHHAEKVTDVNAKIITGYKDGSGLYLPIPTKDSILIVKVKMDGNRVKGTVFRPKALEEEYKKFESIEVSSISYEKGDGYVKLKIEGKNKNGAEVIVDFEAPTTKIFDPYCGVGKYTLYIK